MIKGSNITVVSQFYWPEHVGIAPYSTRLAEHLAGQGAHVEVFTAMPHYPAWRIDSERYRGHLRVREERHGVAVNRMWHYIPQRQSALRRAGYEATLFAHALARRSPPSDAVIGVIPSLSAGAIARTYARRQHCNYGIVVQDLSGQAARQSGITSTGLVGTVTSGLERWVLSAATRVAVVADAFRSHVEAAGVPASHVTLLRNWFEQDGQPRESSPTELSELRRSLNWPDDEHIVLHAGNMGLKQGLEYVVDAAREAQARRLPLRFVLMGDGSQRPAIEERSAGLGNFQLLPNVPRHESDRIMSAADVLLVNERRTIVDMALPSKLTSYFMAGRPVVAAVTPAGTTAQELRRADTGIVVEPENPSALVDAVMKLVANPTLGKELAVRGTTYATEELSAGRALERAERFVEELLSR